MNNKSSFANRSSARLIPFKRFIIGVLIVIVSLGIVILDFIIPLAYALWLVYLVPIYLAFWSSRSKFLWILPAIYTFFIIAAIFWSPPEIGINIDAFNRGLGILLIWATTFILSSRSKAEAALRRSEEIVQSANSIILTADGEGKIDYINNYGLKVFGHTRTWYQGKDIFALIMPAEKFTDQQPQKLITEILSNPEVYRTVINKRRNQAGADVWVSWTLRTITDDTEQLRGIFAVGNDITELKRSQEEAEKGRNMLDGLMAYIPEAIHIVSPDRKILRVSAYNEQLTGYPVAELEGISLQEWYQRIAFYRSDGVTQVQDEELPTIRVLRSAKIIRHEEWKIETVHKEIVDISIDAGPIKNNKQQVIGAVVAWHDVTAYKNAISRLEAAEERERQERELLQTIINSIPVMITIYDRDLHEIYLNKYLTEVTGWTNEDAQRGDLFAAIYPDPAYRQRVIDYIQAITPGFRDLVMKTKAGETLDASWANVRLPDGRQVGIGLDARERKRAEEALKASERKFRTLSENSPDVIARFDRQLRHTYINPYGARVYGWSQEEVPGKTNTELGMPANKVAFWNEHFEEVFASGKQQTIEFDFDSPTLGHLYFQSYIVPEKDELGKVVSILAITRNITELKKYQTQLENSNRDLEQFAYVASHDLQEPLRIVASYTELLERRYKECFDAKGRGFLKYIVDGARRMQRLIQDLLAFSRVGRFNTERSLVDMDQLADRVIADLSAVIQDSKATVTHDPLPRVWANETSLIQVLQNLLGNALKFRKKDIPSKVHISVQKAEKDWLFGVQDNGIGIDPQYFDKLFIIFQRLHSMGEYPGTGIGLAIVKKIIETYGGRVWVSSQPGEGATFYFTLPQKGGGESH